MPAPHRPPRGGFLFPRTGWDHRRRATVAALAAASLVAVAIGRAADAPLRAPVSAIWTGLPLREWAARASALAGRPVVVDRRIDPDTTVTRDCRGEPLGDVLTAVAGEAGAAVESLASWIRVAPAGSAGSAVAGERARAAEIAALPARTRTALAARRPWTWAEGARPRDLVTTAAAAAGIDVAGIERVPHDHVPAASLPPLSLPERLDILLAHYDLRVAWASTGRAVPAGRIVPLEAAVPEGGPGPGRSPDPVRPPEPAPRVAERFTLRLEAPLDKAVETLALRLGLEAEIDRDSLAARGILPGEIVRATVIDASREQVLDAVVAALGLRWRIEGRRLVVEAPPP